MSSLKLITVFKEHAEKKIQIGFILGVFTIYATIFVSTILKIGNNFSVGESFLVWGIYSIPASIFAMDIAFNKREKILFKRFEYCSKILLPAAVIYVFIMLFNINKYTNGVYLGEIDYMTLAYTYMIPMFSLLLGVLLKKI